MGRRGHLRAGRGLDGALALPAGPARDQYAQQLAGIFEPALKAAADVAAGRRPSAVPFFKRTTAFLPETERHRRTVLYGRDKPSDLLSNHTLRYIARRCPVNVAIHSIRRAMVRQVAQQWDGRSNRPGWAIVHKRHFDNDFDQDRVDGLAARIKRVEELIKRPMARFDDTLAGFMVKVTEDHLALDRVAVNKIKGRLDGWSASASGPVAFTHVDGGTIWPADLYLDSLVRLNGLTKADGSLDLDAGVREFYERTGVRLEDLAYLQVDPTRQMDPIAYLTEDDLDVHVANPSPQAHHWGYGIPPTEEGIIAVTLYLSGLGYVASFFRDAFADSVAVVSGSQYRDADIEAVARLFRTHHSGGANAFRSPVVHMAERGDLEFIQTRQHSANEMAFSDNVHHTVMLACAPYGCDPSEINLDARGPGQGSSLSERDRSDEQAVKRDVGALNLLNFLGTRVMTPLIEAHDPDLMFAWMGLDDEDEKNRVDLIVREEDSHLGIDEARKQRGLAPYNEEWSRFPKWRAQQMAQQADQQAAQQQQMEAQQAMQAQGGGDPQAQGGDPQAQGGEEGAQGPQPQGVPPSPMPQHMGWQGDDDEQEAGKAAGGPFIRFEIR